MRDLDTGRGGAERMFIETANMLSQHGHDVACLYYGAPTDHRRLHLDPSVKIVNLAKGDARTAAPTLKRKRLRRVVRKLFQRASQFPPFRQALWTIHHGRFKHALEAYFDTAAPDVAVSYLPPANTPVLLAAEGRPFRVICTNHNRPEADYADPTRWDPNPLDRQLRLQVLDRADAIHVLFEEFADWFPRKLRDKIVVVPNFVSPAIVARSPSVNREKLIIAAGRLAKVKQINVLISAWSKIAGRHPEWRLALYGEGPETGRLRDLAARSNVADSVEFHSFTDNIGDVYQRASILCHPALHEGFGLSVAECLSLGIPVVAFSDCTGVNQLVQHGENGLLVDRERGVDAMADALDRLISDGSLRQRLGANGPASVQMYTPDAFAERWNEVIERVCHDGR